jgi:hypothetical protein
MNFIMKSEGARIEVSKKMHNACRRNGLFADAPAS